MVSSILTAITAYTSTSIDYLVILMLIFTSLKPRERWLVYWGDLLETGCKLIPETTFKRAYNE